MIEKHLLILDIDEALVFSSENPLDLDFDFQMFNYQVMKRPFLEEFIRCVFDWFDVAIWTAATADYAQLIIPGIIPDPTLLKFIWSRRRCTLQRDYEIGDYFWIKDLKKVKRLGYNLDKILVIEDEPRAMLRSYGNLILTSPFQGNLDDSELITLTRFLDWIRIVENVRTVEKRNWRNF